MSHIAVGGQFSPMRHVGARLHAAFLAGLLAFAAIATAQTDTGSIGGFVKDSSGAVVPKANVIVTNEGTAEVHNLTTNETGYYVAPNLPPGFYTITAEATGFKRFQSSHNKLDSNTALSVNAELAIGSNTETVEVSATAAVLQADSAAVQSEVTGSQVSMQELNGRNPLFIVGLLPGIRSSNTMADFIFAMGTTLPFNVNGARPQDTLVTFDGAPANRTKGGGQISGIPDVDAIEEVQVLSTDYAAEYGRAAGGQFHFVSKAGTRDFHGSLYEYFRNSDLNSNTWTRQQSTLTNFTQPFRYNNFGGTIGGPMWAPGMSEKFREKLFFFVAEDWIRYRLGDYTTGAVPTTLMRQGNFSQLLSPNPWYSGSHAIYEPSTCPVSGASTCVPFPGNIIPASQLSYNGNAMINDLPAPTPGFQVGTSNFITQGSSPTNERKGQVNIDILLSPTEKLTGRRSDLSEYAVSSVGSLAQVPTSVQWPNQTNAAALTSTLSPTLLNEARFTFSLYGNYESVLPSAVGLNREGLPIPINFPYLMPNGKDESYKIPNVSVPNFTGLSGGPYPAHSSGPIWVGSDTLTKIWGNHTFKAGISFEYSGENDGDQINTYTVAGGATNQNGAFIFTDTRTGLGGTAGIGLANEALGLADSYTEIGNRALTIWRGWMWEGFAQDSWKVTPKLHLEYGFRFSSIQGFHALWGNADYFDGNVYNPATAPQVSPTTGNVILGTGNPYDGVVIPGLSSFPSAGGRIAAFTSNLCDGASCSGLLNPNLPRNYINNDSVIQPRAGIAYQLTPKTVLRAGAGLFTDRMPLLDNIFPGGNSPFQPTETVTNVSVDNPGASLTSGTAAPLILTTLNPHLKQPEAWNWNFTVERQLPLHSVLTVAYVGHRGLYGWQVYDINQPAAGALVHNPGVNVNALRPYKGFGAIDEEESVVNSTYKGLQIQWERRFASGSSFSVAYTLSKSMDDGSIYRDVAPDAYNTSNLWGPSEYDMRDVVVINWVYAIPFLKNNKQLLGKTLGGWSLAGTEQFQTGVPCGVGANNDYAGVGEEGTLNCGGNGVSDSAGTQGQFWVLNGPVTIDSGAFAGPVTNSSSPKYFTVSASPPPTGTFNLAPGVRNSIYAPGFQDWNLSMFKTFPINERTGFQFRAECYDLPNHPNLSAPNYNPTSSQFGMITSKSALTRTMQLSLRFYF